MAFYRQQLLNLLADGEWHDAADLAQPAFRQERLNAFIRVLRAEGHAIEEAIQGKQRRYRLRPSRAERE
jgi:hypothetical protein